MIFTIFPFAYPMGISSRHQSTGKALLYGLLISIAFIAANGLATKFLILIKVPPVFSSLVFPIATLAVLYKKLVPKVTL
jgi:hypothetical protein